MIHTWIQLRTQSFATIICRTQATSRFSTLLFIGVILEIFLRWTLIWVETATIIAEKGKNDMNRAWINNNCGITSVIILINLIIKIHLASPWIKCGKESFSYDDEGLRTLKGWILKIPKATPFLCLPLDLECVIFMRVFLGESVIVWQT